LEKRDLRSSLRRALEKLFVKITVEHNCLRITQLFILVVLTPWDHPPEGDR